MKFHDDDAGVNASASASASAGASDADADKRWLLLSASLRLLRRGHLLAQRTVVS